MLVERRSPRFAFATVINDVEIQMVEDVERVVLAVPNVTRFFASTGFRDVTTDRKTSRTELLTRRIPVAQGHGHVVDDPMLMIIQNDAFHQPVEVSFIFRIGR